MFKRRAPEDIQKALFEQARRIFLEDGEHPRMVFLVERGKAVPLDVIPTSEPPSENPDAGYYETIAEAVAKYHAEAVILITEAWSAAEHQIGPAERTSESSKRVELLASTLAQKHGVAVVLSCEIHRPAVGAPTLGDTVAEPGSEPYSMEPIYKVWGKYMPDYHRYYSAGPEGAPQTLKARLTQVHREEFEQAGTVLREDGDYPLTAVLLRNGLVIRSMSARAEKDPEEAAKEIAHEMESYEADGVILTVCDWFVNVDEEGNASPIENEGEVLFSTLFYRGRSPASLIATVSRQGDATPMVGEAEVKEADRWMVLPIMHYLAR